MPPNYIEISDDERRKSRVVPSRPIRALAIVADINTRIEGTNSAIKAYKDDVAHLEKLLRSAEERLEEEQERKLKLIEEKNEALNSGVMEMNVRSGLGNGGTKVGVKQEPRVKIEELLQERTGQCIRKQSIFLGVQVPLRVCGESPPNSSKVIKLESPTTPVGGEQTEPSSIQKKKTVPPPPQTTQINGDWDDENSDGNITMGDYDLTYDNEFHYQSAGEQQSGAGGELVSPVPQAKPLRTIPTRGRGWRGGGRNAGRAVGSQGSSGSTTAVPQNSKSFRRETISSAIGGQLQHTWPTPDQNGNFAIRVARYCCVRREFNWRLPSRPGDSENALMFSSRPAGWDGADFPLFIREQSSDWKYYGDYRITECCTVSLREWRGFEETQKIKWCKLMLTKKVILGKRFREGELGRDGWRKVYDLFEKEDTDSRHLRLTARKLKFIQYNRKIYDLLDEISTNQQTSAVRKRKVTRDDVEIGFADDDYAHLAGNDDDDTPQSAMDKRARRKRNCVSYIELSVDSEDNDAQPRTPPLPPAREIQRLGVKEELSDNDDLYSAPSVPRPVRTSHGLVRVHSPGGGNYRDSSVEMWEKKPELWVKPTEDNRMIAAGDDAHKKFDANQLIRVWEPPIINNFPKFPTTKFSRRFLSRVLGGCEQSQECVISEVKKKSQIYSLGVYYCERAEWAPDLPAKPGAHGVVYGTKHGSGAVDFNYSNYPVFCRRKANEWEYCGEYQITRRGFVPGEWSRVAPVAKKSWSEGFAGKRGKWGIAHMLRIGLIQLGQNVTAQDVLGFIDNGLLELECQMYQCVGYNRKLYDTLDAEWEKTMKNSQAMKQELLDED